MVGSCHGCTVTICINYFMFWVTCLRLNHVTQSVIINPVIKRASATFFMVVEIDLFLPDCCPHWCSMQKISRVCKQNKVFLWHNKRAAATLIGIHYGCEPRVVSNSMDWVHSTYSKLSGSNDKTRVKLACVQWFAEGEDYKGFSPTTFATYWSENN